MSNKEKKLVEVRAHFKEDDFDNSKDWEFAFRLLLGNEIGKCLSGQAEDERRSNYDQTSRGKRKIRAIEPPVMFPRIRKLSCN